MKFVVATCTGELVWTEEGWVVAHIGERMGYRAYALRVAARFTADTGQVAWVRRAYW